MASRRKPAVPDELLDQLLDGSDAFETIQCGDLAQDVVRTGAQRRLGSSPDYTVQASATVYG